MKRKIQGHLQQHPFANYIAAPSVRKRAHEKNVNLSDIHGSGKHGRILHTDLDHAQSNKKSSDQKAKLPVLYREIPYQDQCKRIAEERMAAAANIPRVTHYDELDITALLKYFQHMNLNMRVLLDTLFCKALSDALEAYPIFNATFDGEKIDWHEHINLGLKMDAAIFVLPAVQKKTLQAIHKMVTLAYERKSDQSDHEKSSFIFEHRGGIRTTPIIYPPQTATILFHQPRRIPELTADGAYVIRSIVPVSFSFDHRVADGADAVSFTNQLAASMQRPERLFLA